MRLRILKTISKMKEKSKEKGGMGERGWEGLTGNYPRAKSFI